MAQPFRRPHRPPRLWLRRLDRAAARMNPYLMMVAIGLVLLDATCLLLLMSELPAVRLPGYPAHLAAELGPAPITAPDYRARLPY